MRCRRDDDPSCKTLCLGKWLTTSAVVSRLLFAKSALAEPDGLRELALRLFGLLYSGVQLRAFHTEAMVFAGRSQFIVKPDWMNSRL